MMAGSLALLASGKVATVPGAPTIGTATAGNLSASVTFSPPSSDGGSAITSYRATASPGGLSNTGSWSPIVVAGLTQGISYTFTVTATNAVGTGPASAPSNPVTAVTVPGAPTIGTLTSTGGGTLSITFTAPADDGGSAITNYRAQFEDETAQIDSGSVFGASSPIVISGRIVGRSYAVSVAAINAVGEGPGVGAPNIVVA